MDKIIKVKIKNVYGNELIYVVSEHKDTLQKLTGRKTLTENDVKALQDLGFTFQQADMISNILAVSKPINELNENQLNEVRQYG